MLKLDEKMDLYEQLTSLQKKIRTIYIAVPAVGVVIAVFAAIFSYGFSSAPIWILFAAFVLTTVFTISIKKEYVTVYKNLLVRTALESVFDDFKFYPSLGISENEIRFTNMMQLGNRYQSEDYIKGIYKGVPFEQSDVLIQNVTSTGKTTTTITYFEGRWMIFEFNKDFRCDLQVREKGFSYSKKKSGLFTASQEKRQKIEFEDINFNNSFNVYGQDNQEAFYLLTPQIMEAMCDLSHRTNGKIMFCFVHNKLHVAVNTGKDSFEPPIFRNIDIQAECTKISDEINLITQFIELLNLDKTIYKS